jgi:hypothetical protein
MIARFVSGHIGHAVGHMLCGEPAPLCAYCGALLLFDIFLLNVHCMVNNAVPTIF